MRHNILIHKPTIINTQREESNEIPYCNSSQGAEGVWLHILQDRTGSDAAVDEDGSGIHDNQEGEASDEREDRSHNTH